MKKAVLLLATLLAAVVAASAQTLATLATSNEYAVAPAPADGAPGGGLWAADGDDDDDDAGAVETVDGGGDAPACKMDARTKKVLADPRVDPSSYICKKSSFALYGRYCGPGWTDKADRPGIDAVDEACHGHDACYEDAKSKNARKSKELIKAECACDHTLIKTLQTWKKDKAAVAAADPEARRVADDIVAAMPAKCAAYVIAGIFLPHRKAPAPAADDVGSVLG